MIPGTTKYRVTVEDPDTHRVTELTLLAVSVDALKSQIRAIYGPRAHLTYREVREPRRE